MTTITMLEDKAKATLVLYLPIVITYMELTRCVNIFLGNAISYVLKCNWRYKYNVEFLFQSSQGYRYQKQHLKKVVLSLFVTHF